MGGILYTCKRGKREGGIHLGNIAVFGGIILNWILKQHDTIV